MLDREHVIIREKLKKAEERCAEFEAERNLYRDMIQRVRNIALDKRFSDRSVRYMAAAYPTSETIESVKESSRRKQ